MGFDSRETSAIRQAAHAVFGADATVRGFGSCLNARVRGSDLDPATEVEPGQATFQRDVEFRDRIAPARDGVML